MFQTVNRVSAGGTRRAILSNKLLLHWLNLTNEILWNFKQLKYIEESKMKIYQILKFPFFKIENVFDASKYFKSLFFENFENL